MKTVNLELSKELKEAGYPQDTYWSWVIQEFRHCENVFLHESKHTGLYAENRKFASPTCDEILEQLPNEIGGRILRLNKDTVWYEHNSIGAIIDRNIRIPDQFDTIVSNALAKMWLYLKQNGLLEV